MTEPVKLLLVEDDEGDIALTREVFAMCKIANRIEVARDGEAAFTMLQEGRYRPDLILLDLNLPRMSGKELLKELKADTQLRRIPVVVLTSSDAETDIVRSYDLGANCYVTKPVGLPQFEQIVSSIESFWLAVVRLPPG